MNILYNNQKQIKTDKMKKNILIVLLSIMGTMVLGQTTIYDFKVKTIDGKEFDFSTLKGKKIMIVNTASKCGFTGQYEQLEELYKAFENQNFVIIGFPANNFLSQEPGTASEIKEFCTKNYGVTFPMMGKISVKGDDMAEIYKWLTQKEGNGKMDSNVSWNFQKYLIDEKGNLVGKIAPREKPNSTRIIEWIKTGKLMED